MALRPWSKFYWADWRADPKLRMCSLAARGLWVELCGLAHEAEPYGHVLVESMVPTVDQLAMLAGAPRKVVVAALAELETAGVFSRTRDGVIYSRRMVRDKDREQDGREAANRRWGSVEPNGSPNRSPMPKPITPEAISQTDHGDEARARFAALGRQVLATVGALDDPSCRLDYSRVKAWLDAGYDANDDILPCLAEVMRNKRDGPPGSLKYFDKPLAKWHRDRTEPPPPPPKNGPSNAGQSEQLRRRTAQFAGLAAAAESFSAGENAGSGLAALPQPGTAGGSVEVGRSGLPESPVRLSAAGGRTGH